MKRFVDELGEPYSFHYVLRCGESVVVSCPVCGGAAEISRHEDAEGCGRGRVRCSSCSYRADEPASDLRFAASGICCACELWFNESVTDSRQFTQKHIHIACPNCGADNQVPLRVLPGGRVFGSVTEKGRDPMFGLPLYFLSQYKGTPIWALNRRHLAYLIDYISADLRIKPQGPMLRAASYRLPKALKLAKNRSGVLKVLLRLRNLS
ncbi:hypothetical protein B9G55_03410 [Saccharibacillus sp. O16]|nr:hypothetical protein B9G55_03410 [Saccharibacillus sp. O16]